MLRFSVSAPKGDLVNRRAIALSFLTACALCASAALGFALLARRPSGLALWALTILLGFIISRFQRRTGPGYVIPASCDWEGERLNARLPTSFAHDAGCPVGITPTPPAGEASLVYRRFPTSETWQRIPFAPEGEGVVALIPQQPHAGKVEYHIELGHGDRRQNLPPRDNVIVRFRGQVPAATLLPHVLLMLAGMLLSVRAGLETLYSGGAQRLYAVLTLAALVAGGMLFGPLVQKAAFGKYWTGVPNGTDLTDNKTLVAVIVWGLAVLATLLDVPWADAARVAAAGVTLLAFLIPHSLFGSELRYDD